MVRIVAGFVAGFVAVLAMAPLPLDARETPAERVKVLPVFLVPAGEAGPTKDQSERLMRHVEWAERRYRELLGGNQTFAITPGAPAVYKALHDLAFYRSQPEGAAPQFVAELLRHFQVSRTTCPSVYLIIVMNPHQDFPNGGGRPINGGYGTGGAVVTLSSYALDRIPNFQSTVQHELGHAFGLPHVDVYDYSMASNPSLMSYNLAHHTNGFVASATPGALIPEDRRGLAMNQRVFPGLEFEPSRDAPKGYAIHSVVAMGPMNLPDLAPLPGGLTVRLATASGEAYGSHVRQIVGHPIGASRKGEGVTFDPATMWHSDPSPAGKVALEIEFSRDVALSGILVATGHSGQYHPAKKLRLQRVDRGRLIEVVSTSLASTDQRVDFPAATARAWHLELTAGESRTVVVRGLRFYSGKEELAPSATP